MQPEIAPPKIEDGGPPLDDEKGSGAQAVERILKLTRDVSAPPFLAGAFAGSSFLLGIAERRPDLLSSALTGNPQIQFEKALTNAAAEAQAAGSVRDLMRALRRSKEEVAFLAAMFDLSGIWPLEAVMTNLSTAADRFVSLAVRFLLARAAEAGQFRPADPGSPEKDSGLIVLGMGKLGAEELNYSSDIDLIIFFDRSRAPVASGIDAGVFFVRLTRDLVHILQERTGDGYVLRTDLRLRPDPGSTQAAISTEAAFRYYESLGQNWERAALIKARPIAGDIPAGEAFLEELAPYVWRKYLDYNAIADIHAMKRQIHAARGHGEVAVAGHNLKLGRGGIREIEFFVQSQQLIAGGRQPALRTRKTLIALARLAEARWIDARARDELSAAYRELRRLEHRLQMRADQQTHTLPPAGPDLHRFARFAGFSNVDALERSVRPHLDNVRKHYAALFERVPELTPSRVRGNLVFTGDADDPDTVETLRRLGFRHPSSVVAAVKGWHYGRYPAMRSARAREILTEFTPALLEALGETGDPDLALSTFDRFLREAPTALQLFSMLRANPPLLRLLAQIMGSAPRLARILTRRRALMDGILDPGYLGENPSSEELDRLASRVIFEARDYEERLNRARIFGQEQSFAIGVRLLSGRLSPAEAGFAYSRLAETLIAKLLDAVQERFGGAFPEPVILGMGKLGGREMTAASDLDLIAVYDSEGMPQAARHYARLTQRLVSALSAPTSEGELYAVDLRLRPSGKAGPVAVQLEGFAKYQREEAWTWEHMALTRARPVAGHPALSARLSEIVREILTLPRDRAKIAADVREMRTLIAKEKGTQDLWDTRNHPGGTVDVEFAAQFLQLVHAAHTPEVLSVNTQEALNRLIGAGILPADHGATLTEAAGLFQAVAQILRLCTDGAFHPDAAPRDLANLLVRATGASSFSALVEMLESTYERVERAFDDLVT